MIKILDEELLSDYEDRLRAQGLPVEEWARLGLSESEMEQTLAPLGLHLPIEGRLWWGWHDGAQEHFLGPHRDFLSLTEAVSQYRMARASAEETVIPDFPPLDDPDYRWNPAWLPITGGGQETVIDCSVAEGQPTPLRCIDWQDVDSFFEPLTESLRYMVEKRIQAIDSGAWQWDPEHNTWIENDDLLDREFWTNPVL